MNPQRLVALIGLSVVTILASGRTPAAIGGDALPYARGYLLKGGYVAGGVDLTEQANPIDAQGFSTGTIHISGVPADADIVAAYMYFETVTYTASLSDADGVTFRGETVLLNDLMAVKKSKQNLTGATAACWSSGTPVTVTEFRVDVLRWLPIRLDKDNKPTGKRLVNDADLIAHGLPLHQVKLPVRQGNHVPESAGASLVIVYRDPNPLAPLSKIVFYDGVHVETSLSEVTTQTLRGFYKSAATKSAQITHILSAGQPNNKDRIFFDDGVTTQISASNPVTSGSSSQRGWSTLTYDVSSLMNPGNNSGGGYGETARTIVDHAPGGAYDCLTWGAIIFKTAVADVDHDGLPDGLEDAVGGLNDADGQPLPNLNAMGASHSHPDLFMEFNGMWAPRHTVYGGSSASYNSSTTTLEDPNGHNHMPTPETLKLVGDAYVAHGITPHFDVGDIATYHAPNPTNDPQLLGVAAHVDWVDDYTSTIADSYLVPSAYARGGEVIKEVACTADDCEFPDFPGTVGWKFGFQGYRDQPVGANGEELDPSGYASWNAGVTHRRRFDRNRFGLFHYVLYAHARGNPKSDFPCLIAGVPSGYPAGTMACAAGTNNPDFHHPTSSSGVADLPGGNVLVTLGLWDDFVGRPFVRASTTFHESGHNFNLWHGGLPAVWGNLHPLVGSPTSTYIEPNCKPNYLSSMSYLFQVIGLFDNADNIHLDYSDRDYAGTLAFNSVNETMSLTDVEPGSPYIPAWFAPVGSPLAVSEGVTQSTRFCDGSQFGAAPPAPMARVHAADTFSKIDWNGDQVENATAGATNVNFDGTPDGVQVFSSALHGFNDWANIQLDQIGAGRVAVKFQVGPEVGAGDFADFGSGDFTDFGSGDFTDYGSGDFTDFGSGDFTDFGSGIFLQNSSGDFVDFGSGDFTDFGSGDFTDFGSGDFLDFGTGTVRQELDFELAKILTKSSPYHLTACIVGRDAGCTGAAPFSPQYHRVQVDFLNSTIGHVFQYVFERKKGNAASANPYVLAGTTTTFRFIDPTELADGQQYTYHVRTEFDDTISHNFSPWSKAVTITAVNDAPTAYNDGFTTSEDTQLASGNVLTNDTDDDSPAAFKPRSAILVSGPATGTLTTHGSPLNVGGVFDGSFSFAPAPDSEGVVLFTYKANDGTDGGGTPMSPDSNTATVTLNVVSRHTTTTVGSSINPSVYGGAITFTATVTPDSPQLGTPTGMVTFKDGGTTLGSRPLVAGVGSASATFNTSSLAAPLGAGTHSITAVYCGNTTILCAPDTNFYGSTSASLSQVVQKANATIVVTGYNVAFDGNPHTATGTATGVLSESLSGLLGLSGTTHTAVGDYPTDPWTFAGNSNYNSAGDTVHDHIAGVLVIPPPPSVKVDDLTSSTNMFLFVEKTDFVLTSPVHVDISAPGTVNSAPGQLAPLNIPVGTLVNSTYLHHDQPGGSQNTQNVSISFDTDVLGIIALDGSLLSSNAQLGAPGTTYQTFPPAPPTGGQGYEWTGRCSPVSGDQDQITLSPDRRTITVCTNVYSAPDDIRIITKGSPLLIANTAAYGGGPITTFNFLTGATVGSFVPTGAVSPGCNLETRIGCSNGRAVAFFNNEVYYTELADGFGATDAIRVAPFNGGAGGADTRTIPNPRAGTGIQDLAFSGGVLYVLTGYANASLQVFGLNPTTGAVLSGPVNITGLEALPDPSADGFTVLLNGNFLINNGDAECTYNQYDPSTGAVIAGTTIIVPGAVNCTGVETDGASLFFLTDFNSITKTTLLGAFISRTAVASGDIEDIALVK